MQYINKYLGKFVINIFGILAFSIFLLEVISSLCNSIIKNHSTQEIYYNLEPNELTETDRNNFKEAVRKSIIKKKNWSEETISTISETRLFKRLPFESFIGWKQKETHGKYINTDSNGNRQTINNNVEYSKIIDFYGGSTVWGYGVSDSGTIPSLYSSLANNAFSRNYGEQAYNSRQSLNYLMNNSAKEKIGNIIIFYEGINDTIYQCMSREGIFGDARTGVTRSILSAVNEDGVINNFSDHLSLKNKIKLIIPHTIRIIERITGRRFSGDYKIHINQQNKNMCNNNNIAEMVANNIVSNWKIAREIARENNSKFFAILQPNPNIENNDNYYMDNEYKDRIKSIYPLIIKKAGIYDWFIDGSKWLENRNDVYIDIAGHLNRVGNEEIANRINLMVKINN